MAILDVYSDRQNLDYSQAEQQDFATILRIKLEKYPELLTWIQDPDEAYNHTQSYNHKLRRAFKSVEFRTLNFLDAMMNVLYKDTLHARDNSYIYYSKLYAFQESMRDVSSIITYTIDTHTSERLPSTILITSQDEELFEGRDFDQYVKDTIYFNGPDERYIFQEGMTANMRNVIPDTAHCVVYLLSNRTLPEHKPRLIIFYEGKFTRDALYRVMYLHTLHQIACVKEYGMNEDLPEEYNRDMLSYLSQLSVLQQDLTIENYEQYLERLIDWFKTTIQPQLTEAAYEKIIAFFGESVLEQTRVAEQNVAAQRTHCQQHARELRDAQNELEDAIKVHYALKMYPIDDTSGQEFVARLRSSPDVFSNVRTSVWGTNQIGLDITTPLSQYDIDAAYEYYDSHVAWVDMFKENAARRELFKEIFIKQTIKVIFKQRVILNLTTREIDFGNTTAGNPHLSQYRCLGGYYTDVFDAFERRDYGTMLDILVSSVSNVDLYDSIVMNHWFAVWGISEDPNLELEAGTRTSFVRYLSNWELPAGTTYYSTPDYQGSNDPLEELASDEYMENHDNDDEDDDEDWEE